jgi:hypothetical protein
MVKIKKLLFSYFNNSRGGGNIKNLITDLSGREKKELRLVLGVNVLFDTGVSVNIIIKLAPIKNLADLKKTEQNDTLQAYETSEIALENNYLHESYIYNIMSKKSEEDVIINDHVLKSYNCDVGRVTTTKAKIIIKNNNNEMEELDIFSISEIKTLYENYINKEAFIYITTELNENYLILKDQIFPKNINIQQNFVVSTISTLVYMYRLYGFCHWDFHSGNILYDKRNGNIKLFDFDFSTINIYGENPIVKNSKYIQYVSFFYVLIQKYLHNYDTKKSTVVDTTTIYGIEFKTKSFKADSIREATATSGKASAITSKNSADIKYYKAKILLAHFYDIFLFLQGCLDSNIPLEKNDFGIHNKLIEIFNNIMNDNQMYSSFSLYLENNLNMKDLRTGKLLNNYCKNNKISGLTKDKLSEFSEAIYNYIMKFREDPYWGYTDRIWCAFLLLNQMEEYRGNSFMDEVYI